MTSYSERARKAASAQAFHANRDRQRRLASKRDMASHVEVGNEQTRHENAMREHDLVFIKHMRQFYPQIYKGPK